MKLINLYNSAVINLLMTTRKEMKIPEHTTLATYYK